jgi:AraC-like DNA-binding protein
MSPDLLLLCLDAALAACTASLGISALARAPRTVDAWLIAALSCAVIAHVVLGRQDYGPWIAPPFRVRLGALTPWLDVLRNAAPGIVMILVHRRFTDGASLPGWLLVLFVLQLGLEGPLRLAGLTTRVGAEAIPTLLQALFAGAAVWWIVADWRADLVDARRRSRAVVLLVLSVSVVASSLLLRVVIPPGVRANYDAHVALSVWNLILLLALAARGLAQDLRRDPQRAPRQAPASPPTSADDAALARLERLLGHDRIYREPDLSLAGLAARVGLPEYRLRRLIHERLGFRNFNSFLHAYRIAEVVRALGDDRQRRTPILTLAFDAGYRSVNTFNRGFRDVMGVTPSAYRRETEAALAAPRSPEAA